MKRLLVSAAVGLGLLGSLPPALAQFYGGPGYGGGRGYDYEDREDYGPPGRRYGQRRFAFDEREYLRCNPDVRRAVFRGQVESGLAHYRIFGRREGRALSC